MMAVIAAAGMVKSAAVTAVTAVRVPYARVSYRASTTGVMTPAPLLRQPAPRWARMDQLDAATDGGSRPR